MYNIKQAAARAGVSVPVLRAWERRYGIVHPVRTASGYRQFDDEAIARIRTMRGLVQEGWSPSAAAAAILAGEVPERSPSGTQSSGIDEQASAVGGTPDAANGAMDLPGRLVEASRALDSEAVEHVLDDLFARGSFERVTGDLLFPSLRLVGDAWAGGRLSVAGEHLASHAVLRRLGLALDGAGRTLTGRPRVIVGLPPGARHELGALAFAVAARRAGLAVDYLGADLPVDDWVGAAASADAAVVGVVARRDRTAALAVARALRAAYPALVVAFGGAAAPPEPGVLDLAGSLPEAIEALSAELTAAG
jgi:DNA-binding transcriptional MerR regulator/methylmalonyl-CoA mutase cobalamin-binding subunit